MQQQIVTAAAVIAALGVIVRGGIIPIANAIKRGGEELSERLEATIDTRIAGPLAAVQARIDEVDERSRARSADAAALAEQMAALEIRFDGLAHTVGQVQDVTSQTEHVIVHHLRGNGTTPPIWRVIDGQDARLARLEEQVRETHHLMPKRRDDIVAPPIQGESNE